MSGITTSIPTAPPMVQAPVIPGPRSFPAASAVPTLTIQDVIRILKRYLFLIMGIWIFVFTCTIVLTYIWKNWYPSYLATALVEVRSPIVPPALSQETQMVAKDIIEQTMNTQAATIRSQTTLQDALKDPLIKDTKWYRSFQVGENIDFGAAMIDMQRRFSASAIHDTNLVSVGFSWRDPGECKRIVNTVLDTYYQSVRVASQEKTRNELKKYQDQESNLRQDLTQQVDIQEQFRSHNNIPLLQEKRGSFGDQVSALTQLLAMAMTEKDQYQSLYEMYNQPGAMERIAETPEMRQMVEGDGFVRTYTQYLTDSRISLSTMKEKGLKNRNVQELENRVALMEKELNEKRRQLISDTYRDMRERTKVDLDTVISRVAGLNNRLAEAKAESSELEKQLSAYLVREKEIDRLRKQLESLGDQIFKLKLQLENPELVRVSVRGAVEPLEPDMPKWSMNLPAGFVLGLILGIGLAFLLEFMGTTVRTPSDVLRQLHMPLLGQIPSQDEDESSAQEMRRLMLESPHSMLAESFRQLRANFLFCAPPERQGSILITSCSPSEGKTCVSVNLAVSLSQAGRKVLLVDANFRRPGVAQAFGLEESTEGLSNILIGHSDPDSLVRQTPHKTLDVLPAGPLPPNPSELLSGGYLKNFIAQFSTKYETIIFDGPPVLVVSDAMVLSSVMDGVVLVVRAGFSARGAIGRAKDQLKRVNAKILGVVLNDVKITRGGYFREMYKTYDEYQSPPALPAEEAEETTDKMTKA